MLRFLGWLFSVIFAFSLGTGYHAEKPEASELQQKVQGHVDTIVDETAAIVDDIMDEARKDERVQNAEAFADDVKEIVDNTVKDIHDHFGPEETEEDADGEAETAEVPVEPAEETTTTEAAKE